jgi:CHASE1-domain containing sensor protein
MRDRGHAGYRIKPSGARAEYSSIIYLEPFNWRNQRAFAYDMLSEPVRGEAMRRARSTGEAALSGKVRLIQETDRDVQTGVLLYLPAYHHGMPTDTVEQRAAALAGWVYSPFRMDDLMRGTLGKASDSLRLRIHDGPESLPDSLLYDSHPGDPDRHGAAELIRSCATSTDAAGQLIVRNTRGVGCGHGSLAGRTRTDGAVRRYCS